MPKTKDAFAHRNFTDILTMVHDRIYFLSSSLLNDLNNNEYSKMVAKLREVRSLRRKLFRRIFLLSNQCERLEKYSRIIQTRWLIDKTMSGKIAAEKLERAARLLAHYQYGKEFLSKYGDDVNQFIRQVENKTNIWQREIFSSRLKEARKAKKITQTQIAAKIGIKQSSYAQYENMKREPSLQILVQLSKILERSTDWLLGLTP